MKFFALAAPRNAPRGDYGDILLHGLGDHASNGDVEVERVGPYAPPMSFPGPHVVVKPGVRSAIEADFPTLAFVPVRLKKAVWFRWRGWHRLRWRYPDSGKSEDYIYQGAHSERAAKAVGALWALELPVIEGIAETTKDWGDHTSDVESLMATLQSEQINRSRWSGQVCFRTSDIGRTYVVEPLADWLRQRYAKHVDLREVPSFKT